MASVKNSKDECQIWCQDVSECKFFTYSKNDKKCYLKTDDYGKILGPGLISGPKFCLEGLNMWLEWNYIVINILHMNSDSSWTCNIYQ